MTETEELKQIVLAQANRIEGLLNLLHSAGASFCICGHPMGEHVDAADDCTACDCTEFQHPATDAPVVLKRQSDG